MVHAATQGDAEVHRPAARPARHRIRQGHRWCVSQAAGCAYQLRAPVSLTRDTRHQAVAKKNIRDERSSSRAALCPDQLGRRGRERRLQLVGGRDPSADSRYLCAGNAGGNDISSFATVEPELRLVGKVPLEGAGRSASRYKPGSDGISLYQTGVAVPLLVQITGFSGLAIHAGWPSWRAVTLAMELKVR
jgi:hypothetical protein